MTFPRVAMCLITLCCFALGGFMLYISPGAWGWTSTPFFLIGVFYALFIWTAWEDM